MRTLLCLVACIVVASGATGCVYHQYDHDHGHAEHRTGHYRAERSHDYHGYYRDRDEDSQRRDHRH